MIGLRFKGANDKIERILIHKGIYVSHEILGAKVIICFKSTPPSKKESKPPIEYTWSFTKSITDILNWVEVEAFLKSIKNTDISKPKKPGQNQASLDF
jgi:hypothetical protein